jgi:hypothetical protein
MGGAVGLVVVGLMAAGLTVNQCSRPKEVEGTSFDNKMRERLSMVGGEIKVIRAPIVFGPGVEIMDMPSEKSPVVLEVKPGEAILNEGAILVEELSPLDSATTNAWFLIFNNERMDYVKVCPDTKDKIQFYDEQLKRWREFEPINLREVNPPQEKAVIALPIMFEADNQTIDQQPVFRDSKTREAYRLGYQVEKVDMQ